MTHTVLKFQVQYTSPTVFFEVNKGKKTCVITSLSQKWKIEILEVQLYSNRK